MESYLVMKPVFSYLAVKLTHLHVLLRARKCISHFRQADTFPVMDLLWTL